MSNSVAFWSYAREDDASDSGRIRVLAEAVRSEFALLTGVELDLFIDRDIEWGDAWRTRIDEALAETTFFIPVVTPRYFMRPECRRELLTFAGHAKSLGREDLILPIHYVEVPGLAGSDGRDEAVQIVASMQWLDWRDLRLEPVESSEYRRAISAAARRLADRGQEALVVSRKPEAPSGWSSIEDEPGALELVAQAEDAFPRLNETLERMAAELDILTATAEQWTPVVRRAARNGAGPVLHVLKQFADEVAPVADRLDGLGRAYSSELVRVDPGVLAVIRLWELGERDPVEAGEMLDGIRTMCRSGQDAVAVLEDFVGTLNSIGGLSRDVKRPLAKVASAVLQVRDGQAVIEEWLRRAEHVHGLYNQDPA